MALALCCSPSLQSCVVHGCMYLIKGVWFEQAWSMMMIHFEGALSGKCTLKVKLANQILLVQLNCLTAEPIKLTHHT